MKLVNNIPAKGIPVSTAIQMNECTLMVLALCRLHAPEAMKEVEASPAGEHLSQLEETIDKSIIHLHILKNAESAMQQKAAEGN